MKLRKSFETQNNIPNWNSEERCTQLEASLNYYKSKSADCAFCILFFLAQYFFFLCNIHRFLIQYQCSKVNKI